MPDPALKLGKQVPPDLNLPNCRYKREVSSENQVWEGQNGAMRRRRALLTFTLHSTVGISFIGGNVYRLTLGGFPPHTDGGGGGDFSQTEVCSRTEMCGEPKAIPLVDAPIREWNAIEEAECRAKEDIPEFGVSRRPGSSDALHHEGKPSASLFRLMESEVLDWKVAGTGSARCRKEPAVSPNTWPTGGKMTDCRGGKTNASPNCQTEEKWGWTRSAHQTSRCGCDRSEWGERVWGGQIRFLRSGLALWRWSGSPHPDSKVRKDLEEPKRQACRAASGQPLCVVAGEGRAGHGLPRQ